MKAYEFINETPLPQEWDKDIYKSTTSFQKRIEYAKQMAKKIGAGTSRVAFEIDYKGRPTILKVAKNKKGLAQNEFEAGILSDHYVRSLDITIPIIDYDEKHNQPLWIHVEKAERMTIAEFKKYFNGLKPYDLIHLTRYMTGKLPSRNLRTDLKNRYEEIAEDNEYVSSLINLTSNYDMPTGDFSRLVNWGVFNGHPVIIDVGLSNEVLNKYYRL